MSTPELWAAIFDWDGVIIDSSRQHDLAWQELARKSGRQLPAGFFARSFGMKNEQVIPQLLAWTIDVVQIGELSRYKEELYRQLVRHDGISTLPGVTVFLEQLQAHEIPCAIASSTPRENIELVLDQLGIRSSFGAIVAAEDVSLGKPNPEVFLLAAERLRVSPACCVVFEDAHVGITAALAAGMKVVAVASTHPAESLQQAHRVVKRLDELNPAQISALLTQQAP